MNFLKLLFESIADKFRSVSENVHDRIKYGSSGGGGGLSLSPGGVREMLNQNPSIMIGATAIVILLALGYAAVSFFEIGSGAGSTAGIPTKEFFTTDDGKTLFTDDRNKVPPFDKDGKKAYRARVFSCDGDKTRFTGYLERVTDKARAELEKLRADPKNPSAAMMISSTMQLGIEVKKPGTPDKDWFLLNTKGYSDVVGSVRCPDGKSELTPIFP